MLASPSAKLVLFWRAVRAADGASLENWWAEMSLGFESLALRIAFEVEIPVLTGM